MTPPSPLKPLYTPHNCHAAYQLNWSLDIFWKTAEEAALWLPALQKRTEADCVRILQHRFAAPGISQCFVSTRPHVSPVSLARSVKGRLQHLLGAEQPHAFKRNYGIRSIGAATRAEVDCYVTTQVEHHKPADSRVQATLGDMQLCFPEVDLGLARRGAHAVFWYNLHVVLVNDGHWREIRRDVLEKQRDALPRIAAARGHLLTRAAILPDHIHLVVGCPPDAAPEEVALCYLNNLAFVLGMKPWFKAGYYVGTVGEYDRGAVGNAGQELKPGTN